MFLIAIQPILKKSAFFLNIRISTAAAHTMQQHTILRLLGAVLRDAAGWLGRRGALSLLSRRPAFDDRRTVHPICPVLSDEDL